MSLGARPGGREAVVYLATSGVVANDVIETVGQAVGDRFGLRVSRRPHAVDPVAAWDPVRGQYSSIVMMRRALAVLPRGALRMLVITEVDLFVPVLSFVFGHAQLDGPVAIMATARLRQSFYGLPSDRGLELRRARIEAVHEIGHTFGLTHCIDRDCAMSLATTVDHVDRKRDDYCAGCRELVSDALARACEMEIPMAGLGGAR